MANYWAQFERVGPYLFRFDTRIYMNDVASCLESDPPIGAIVAKNPGSAGPDDPNSTTLQTVSLNGGQLLPTVYNVAKKAFLRAGCQWPERAYIQVFNLFYLCDKNAKQALSAASKTTLRTCSRESARIPWLWYAWGNMGNQLPRLSSRFSRLSATDRFYFDKSLGTICVGHPAPKSFPKHTQGLTQEPIIAHIAKLLTKCPNGQTKVSGCAGVNRFGIGNGRVLR